MKRVLRSIVTSVLAVSLVIPACSFDVRGEQNQAKAAEQLQPAYKWTFENTEGSNVVSEGTAADGNAILKGKAKVEAQSVEMDGKSYSSAGNHVLTLSGGAKGSSYAELPSSLYKGVNAETGLTWSFWMKPNGNVASYSRLFSSTDSHNKNEFAFTPYASDSVWNLIFDDNASYKHIFDAEPAKGAWTLMTITVSGEEVQFYENGVLVDTTCGGGDSNTLESRLNSISSLVNNALGKTCSTWSDQDCAIQLDDVSLYHTVLSAEQIKTMAEGYGIDVSQQKPPVEEISDDDGSAGLTEIEDLKTTSVDGSNEVRIWQDANKQYYYSANREGAIVMKCSPIGVHTKKADLSKGLELVPDSIQKKKGKEEYDWVQGSSNHVSKEYQETSFTLTKGSAKITVIFRLFNDGMAYRYEIDGETDKSNEVTEVTSEDSSFILPDATNIWTMPLTSTYEASSYTSRKVSKLTSLDSTFAPPILGKVPTKSGECWVLLAEANVYNEEEPYCASGLCTTSGSKAIQVKFGRYLKEEEDESKDGKTYSPTYEQISSVKMTDVFHTPWRVTVMTDNLEDLVNTSLISDLNPEAQGDFSWVEPGTSSWSWWSTTSDAIDYDTMYDYIDYAQETGQKYCLVDFGWENWNDYETKLKDLVSYADEKGVGILVWYGVNKFDQPHKFDLDNAETIEEEFAWCEKLGIKGVKVDYFNSDSQFAMKVMYDIASIAAKHKLVVNYHGCTDPNGENRTFPNILSSEAVMGSEYFKWSSGSPVQSLLMLPYARNVIGSMEFTPVGMSVKNVAATDGFMLAMPVVYESAMQTLAHSCYVYPGYGGTSFLTDIPSTWDESRLLDGSAPGVAAIRARKKGDVWYLGAMTKDAKTYDIKLDFLDKDQKYFAYIYTDKEDLSGIHMEKREVTSADQLNIDLKKSGGCAIKFSKTDNLKETVYDKYNYYEAENAYLGKENTIKSSAYVSRQQFVGKIKGAENRVAFENIEAPEAGMYELKLYVVSSGKRKIYIRANKYESTEVSDVIGVSGDSNAVGCKSAQIYLDKGMNTIYLYNPTTTGPDLDRIAVSKTAVSAGTVPAITDSDPALYEDYRQPVETPTPSPAATPTPAPTPAPTQPTATPEPDKPVVQPTQQPKTDKVVKPAKVKNLKVTSKKKKQVKVTFGKVSKADGYQICYSRNKKWKKAKKITVKASVTKKTIKKLKRKKKYYVRVRAFRKSGKKKLYGNWSAVKKVKIK